MAPAEQATMQQTAGPKTNEHSAADKFWRDSEITSDADVERDTYTPSRQRKLLAELRYRLPAN